MFLAHPHVPLSECQTLVQHPQLGLQSKTFSSRIWKSKTIQNVTTNNFPNKNKILTGLGRIIMQTTSKNKHLNAENQTGMENSWGGRDE